MVGARDAQTVDWPIETVDCEADRDTKNHDINMLKEIFCGLDCQLSKIWLTAGRATQAVALPVSTILWNSARIPL
jgi:hypothetical protein